MSNVQLTQILTKLSTARVKEAHHIASDFYLRDSLDDYKDILSNDEIEYLYQLNDVDEHLIVEYYCKHANSYSFNEEEINVLKNAINSTSARYAFWFVNDWEIGNLDEEFDIFMNDLFRKNNSREFRESVYAKLVELL